MLPKEGWIHEGVEDLKYPTGRCELCDTPIRFEHFVFHEEVGVLIIGCECAKRIMSGKELDYIKDQDRKMKAKARQEKATVERMVRNWNERNAFNAARGLPTITWDEYLAIIEANKKREEAKKSAREKKS